MEKYQQQVVVEKSEIDVRAIALSNFIGLSPQFEKIDSAEQCRLREQNDIMWQYSEILGKRIDAFCDSEFVADSHKYVGLLEHLRAMFPLRAFFLHRIEYDTLCNLVCASGNVASSYPLEWLDRTFGHVSLADDVEIGECPDFVAVAVEYLKRKGGTP